MEKMKQELADAETRASQEREALDRVEAELLAMFADPELRKRCFAIVEQSEIEENEFNLNIPRYVDTFEPEEEIPIEDAARALRQCLETESALGKELQPLLDLASD
jgi:type I restriction enzyme M protein